MDTKASKPEETQAADNKVPDKWNFSRFRIPPNLERSPFTLVDRHCNGRFIVDSSTAVQQGSRSLLVTATGEKHALILDDAAKKKIKETEQSPVIAKQQSKPPLPDWRPEQQIAESSIPPTCDSVSNLKSRKEKKALRPHCSAKKGLVPRISARPHCSCLKKAKVTYADVQTQTSARSLQCPLTTSSRTPGQNNELEKVTFTEQTKDLIHKQPESHSKIAAIIDVLHRIVAGMMLFILVSWLFSVVFKVDNIYLASMKSVYDRWCPKKEPPKTNLQLVKDYLREYFPVFHF